MFLLIYFFSQSLAIAINLLKSVTIMSLKMDPIQETDLIPKTEKIEESDKYPRFQFQEDYGADTGCYKAHPVTMQKGCMDE
jgi:hypothetical protein